MHMLADLHSMFDGRNHDELDLFLHNLLVRV